MFDFLRKAFGAEQAKAPHKVRSQPKVLVVGAGHNGLICAGYLAKAGLDVVVLEARPEVGGGAVTREVSDGYRVPACAHILTAVNASIVKDLKLTKHGLTFAHRELDTTAPDGNGEAVRLSVDPRKSRSSIERLSRQDAEAYVNFHEELARHGALFAALATGMPPVASAANAGFAESWAAFAKALKKFDAHASREFFRQLFAAAGDVLDEQFESDLVKGVFAAESIWGMKAGPRSLNTMLSLFVQYGARLLAGREAMAIARGGPGGFISALSQAAQGFGADIRAGARVTSITVKEERATGAILDSGEEIHADLVVSATDAVTTLLDLVGPLHFDTGLVKHLRNLPIDGVTAKLNVALHDLPNFTGLVDQDYRGRIIICPSVDYAERAFNAVKYGDSSQEPVMEIVFPSVHDPSMAPSGRHVMSANLQFVPYRIAGEFDDEKSALINRVVDVLSFYAPDIRDKLVDGELLTPLDIEREFGLRGGHWHHGDLSLDRIGAFRSLPGVSHYATPLSGLYLCSAGTHPGGGLTGQPGRSAARRIIADLKAETSIGIAHE